MRLEFDYHHREQTIFTHLHITLLIKFTRIMRGGFSFAFFSIGHEAWGERKLGMKIAGEKRRASKNG